MDTVLILTIALLNLQAFAALSPTMGNPCADSDIQMRRSEELQKIRAADQADRAWQEKGEPPSKKMLEHMSENDLARRKRVGEIFGEGCLKSMADYEAAFIVFQHGNTPDQYFQAFLWSKKAVDLGNTHAKADVAVAIDRYLVSVGQRQLFGTQASQSDLGGCWCIQPTDESFPQALRTEYRGGGNAAYTGLAYLKVLNGERNCPVPYCPTELRPSPRGTVPGFW